MADTTRNLDSGNLKLSVLAEKEAERCESFRDCVQFRTAGAANGDNDFFHAARILSGTASADEMYSFSLLRWQEGRSERAARHHIISKGEFVSRERIVLPEIPSSPRWM